MIINYDTTIIRYIFEIVIIKYYYYAKVFMFIMYYSMVMKTHLILTPLNKCLECKLFVLS